MWRNFRYNIFIRTNVISVFRSSGFFLDSSVPKNSKNYSLMLGSFKELFIIISSHHTISLGRLIISCASLLIFSPSRIKVTYRVWRTRLKNARSPKKTCEGTLFHNRYFHLNLRFETFWDDSDQQKIQEMLPSGMWTRLFFIRIRIESSVFEVRVRGTHRQNYRVAPLLIIDVIESSIFDRKMKIKSFFCWKINFWTKWI